GLAVVAGLANFPRLALWPDSFELRFEYFYEPKGAYFPSVLPSFAAPVFSPGIALASTLIGLIGIGLAYMWFWRGAGPQHVTERSRVAHAGYTFLVDKYYFDHLYVDVIAAGVKGPVARASNW